MRNSDARELVAVLLRTPGVMPRAQIVERWSEPALRAAVRSGTTTAVLPGLFAATVHAESLVARAHAASLWCGRNAVITGAAALHAWGLLEDAPQHVRVSTHWGLKRDCPPWLSLSRTSTPSPVAQWFGFDIATPASAIVRGFGDLAPDVARNVVYRAIRDREMTVDQLRERLSIEPRVRNRKALERVVDACAAGSESHLETLSLRTVFNTSEFAHFVRQHRVRVQGKLYRLDTFDPETLTAIELDGARGHGDSGGRQKDVTRDALLAGIGIVTLRFTYGDIANRSAWVRHVVRDVVAHRRSQLGRVA